MKQFIFLVGIIWSTTLFAKVTKLKEIELAIQVKTDYPLTIHYHFSTRDHRWAQGNLNTIHNNQRYYVYVNRIPKGKQVLVQINKMNAGNVTEFGDPCEINLSPKQLRADVIVGFKGNPYRHHGSFNCEIEAS